MFDQILRVIRLASVGLVLAAIGAQLITLANAGALNIVNFFSYFTIQSNLIGVAVLLLAAFRGVGSHSARLDWWRGAAAMYLTVTFVVVILLLRGIDVGLQLPWVDFVLHTLFPVVVVLDYVVDPPSHRVSSRAALGWLVFPVAWLAYTMIRGPIAGWYPYPFLDPADGGYGPVLVTIAIILVAGALLSVAFAWIGRMRGRSSTASSA